MNRAIITIIAGIAASPVRAEEPAFLPDVAPVVVSRCVSCHGDVKARGEYRLDNFANLLKPGASDSQPVVPGKPEESELYRRLIAADPKMRMPPGDDPLTAEEIATIKKWIAAGGKFDGNRTASLKSILPPRKHAAAPEKYPTAAPVCAIAFSPDGKELAVGGVNEVTIWDAANGKLLRRLPRQPARIHALAYSTDGKRLLVGGGTVGEYGDAAIVDATTGNREKVFGPFDDLVLSVAFAPDGKRIVAGSADHTARCFSTETSEELWRSQLHSDWVTGVAFSPGGRWIATSSKDRTVKVLYGTGKLFTTYNGHRRQFSPHVGQLEVYAVQFDSSGTAYSVGAGAAVRVWHPVKAHDENGSAADMEERFKNIGHTRYLEYTAGKPVFSLAVGGGQVFSAGGDKLVRHHDAANAKLVREYAGHADWIYSCAIHPASERMASGAFDGEVRVWNTKTGDLVVSFKATPGLAK